MDNQRLEAVRLHRKDTDEASRTEAVLTKMGRRGQMKISETKNRID